MSQTEQKAVTEVKQPEAKEGALLNEEFTNFVQAFVVRAARDPANWFRACIIDDTKNVLQPVTQGAYNLPDQARLDFFEHTVLAIRGAYKNWRPTHFARHGYQAMFVVNRCSAKVTETKGKLDFAISLKCEVFSPENLASFAKNGQIKASPPERNRKVTL